MRKVLSNIVLFLAVVAIFGGFSLNVPEKAEAEGNWDRFFVVEEAIFGYTEPKVNFDSFAGFQTQPGEYPLLETRFDEFQTSWNLIADQANEQFVWIPVWSSAPTKAPAAQLNPSVVATEVAEEPIVEMQTVVEVNDSTNPTEMAEIDSFYGIKPGMLTALLVAFSLIAILGMTQISVVEKGLKNMRSAEETPDQGEPETGTTDEATQSFSKTQEVKTKTEEANAEAPESDAKEEQQPEPTRDTSAAILNRVRNGDRQAGLDVIAKLKNLHNENAWAFFKKVLGSGSKAAAIVNRSEIDVLAEALKEERVYNDIKKELDQ